MMSWVCADDIDTDRRWLPNSGCRRGCKSRHFAIPERHWNSVHDACCSSRTNCASSMEMPSFVFATKFSCIEQLCNGASHCIEPHKCLHAHMLLPEVVSEGVQRNKGGLSIWYEDHLLRRGQLGLTGFGSCSSCGLTFLSGLQHCWHVFHQLLDAPLPPVHRLIRLGQ